MIRPTKKIEIEIYADSEASFYFVLDKLKYSPFDPYLLKIIPLDSIHYPDLIHNFSIM